MGKKTRSKGIIIVVDLMILFGIAEVVTSFTHNFLGVATSSGSMFTYLAAAIGVFYIAAGALILTLKKWAAALAITLLGADIIGRVFLVLTGFYPTDSFKPTFAIIAGTAIAGIFAVYIGLKWKSFK